jgi:hypothetical protein
MGRESLFPNCLALLLRSKQIGRSSRDILTAVSSRHGVLEAGLDAMEMQEPKRQEQRKSANPQQAAFTL